MKNRYRLYLALVCVAGTALAGVRVAVAETVAVHAEADFAPPAKALVLRLDRQQWQTLTAACITPVFYNHGGSVPLILDDGTSNPEVAIPATSASVKDFGPDAQAATAAIARKYWKKAETVFAVADYEHALWIVPSASLLSAPILVNPDAATLKALGTTKAVVVGSIKIPNVEVVALDGKEAVWKFQLRLMNELKIPCDYVIATNPTDTADKLDPNVQWPYLSLASAPLAAYRHAIVQTGNYTGDRQKLNDLGVSLGDQADAEKLASVMPVMKRLKADCRAAAKYLISNGQKPRFLAMVGGSKALPHYYIDLHAKYTFWSLSIDYVPSDTPYATLRADVDFTHFVKPDLAVGRIMADNIHDASLMLVKTFFRKQYLPGGRYASLAPQGWEKRAIVLDGHRLNQPDEGGPDASPHEPFHPAGEVAHEFAKAGLAASYVFPRDETNPQSTGLKAPDLFHSTSDYGFVQYVAHGDPPYLRIESGRTGKDLKNYLATGAEYRKRLNFKAPTVAYVIGCNVGTVNANFRTNAEYLPPAAIHAGLIAYMAPNKCQSICFWRYAPKGVGADQAILFWDNFLMKKMTVGEALLEAKWQAYQRWAPKQSADQSSKDSNNCIEIDAPSLVLFGDPALTLAD
ncbi:MAG TPA: C25 family cysteine peptidase [Pirellulales bacterium]|jgi:hypothetical protein|nr:C25 family cysteine peptidase [Pirellulales bacterium]